MVIAFNHYDSSTKLTSASPRATHGDAHLTRGLPVRRFGANTINRTNGRGSLRSEALVQVRSAARQRSSRAAGSARFSVASSCPMLSCTQPRATSASSTPTTDGHGRAQIWRPARHHAVLVHPRGERRDRAVISWVYREEMGHVRILKGRHRAGARSRKQLVGKRHRSTYRSQPRFSRMVTQRWLPGDDYPVRDPGKGCPSTMQAAAPFCAVLHRSAHATNSLTVAALQPTVSRRRG